MNYYTGKQGQSYYDMRAQRRDDFLQERRARHFQEFIEDSDVVLDFGCGTGGVLHHLRCSQKIGIEVNSPSIQEAQEKNITIHEALSNVEDSFIDVVISYHALEHVINPAQQIQQLHRVLKKGGKIILIVPSENPSASRFKKWVKDDPDQHISSWTPLSFGNLATQCGFNIEKSYKSPIGYSKYTKPLARINECAFQMSRKVVAFLLDRYEVILIAHKD